MSKIKILDGGLGTMLQKYGMPPDKNPVIFGFENEEILKKIHSDYIDAGSDIIFCNSFSINPIKFKNMPISLEDAVEKSIKIAKAAVNRSNRHVKVAFDMSTLGELLEPIGTLSFEAAYEAYKETAILAEKYSSDLIIIETMTDLYELKAAILAVKENTSLPVYTSMTFEKNGRTFTGVSLETMVITLEGLGVDALGINCSLGPMEIYPLAKKLVSLTSLPVLIKPNAGLPDPETGKYNMSSDEFVKTLSSYSNLGVSMLGGCCGTEPEHIMKLSKALQDKLVNKDSSDNKSQSCSAFGDKNDFSSPLGSAICTSTKLVKIDQVRVIGERLNPTGKKRLKEAYVNKDWDYILSQAIQQIDAGADILDINVGVPGLNQEEFLPILVKKLQTVIDIPLQIDSSDPRAIEAALRVYNGKGIVNSVTGEDESLAAILPIVKKYGAAVIGLTIDENGIPKSSKDRIKIAKKILNEALSLGIKKDNIYIDCLTLTASAEQSQAMETIAAIEYISKELGLNTTLGVSNISFGLPNRSLINSAFLLLALNAGLTLPIIDPSNTHVMSTIFTFNLLANKDTNSKRYIEYIEKISNPQNQLTLAPSHEADSTVDIETYIKKGLKEAVANGVKTLLLSHSPLDIVNNSLIPALDKVGKDFENGKIYLPQMLQSAVAAQGGFEQIKNHLSMENKPSICRGKLAIATVKGDIHDIGKNIVKMIMENYGYDVLDLGKDVSVKEVVDVVLTYNLKLIGLSALMTTTLESMEDTIKEIKKVAPDCKIMVGGAVLTEEYAYKIGADFYCKDALSSVAVGNLIFELT